MPIALYNPNGGPITAMALFSNRSVMVVNYEMMLRQRDSNATTTLKIGDNLNPEDDNANLPMPPSLNEGRRVFLETGFVGHAAGGSYQIRLEIWQDGQCIGSHAHAGKLTGDGQYSLLFVELQSAIANNSNNT